AIGSFVLSRRFWSINLRFAWADAKGLVRDSFALWGITVIGLLHFKSDVLVLAATRSSHEVGVYAVAYAFLEQTMFIPSGFIAVLVNLNKQRLLMIVAATTLVLNTGLNLYLIPKYGYDAAAATTVFTEGLGFVLSVWFAARSRSLGLSPALAARVAMAGIAGAVVGAMLRNAPELVTGAA